MKMLPVNRILQGDCLQVMQQWPENSVDMVMTSPPYWGLRNYGDVTEVDWGDWKGQLGLEPTWQMYVAHMVLICQEVKRVLKRTGSMYLVLGDTYFGGKGRSGYELPHEAEDRRKQKITLQRGYNVPGYLEARPNDLPQQPYQVKCLMGMPWRVAFALISDGWILRERIVWHKDNPMPGSQRDRLTQTCEVIFHFVRNTGKALLWRNELTCEWLEKRPKQVYFHVETHELREGRPSKEEKYVVDEFGNRRLVWKPLWRGFDYYYELDAIREPHKTSSVKRAGPSGVVPFNLRVQQVKRGKKGVFVEDGKVKQLKASEKEVETYVYPEKPFQAKKKPYLKNNPHRMRLQKQKFLALNPSRPSDLSHPKGKNPGDVTLTKHDVAVRRFPTVNRKGGLGYTDPLHVKAYHEKGKNPGDVVRVQPESHGHDRLGSRGPGLRPWTERFHPRGKNPEDIVKWADVPGQAQQGNFGHGGTHANRFNHPDGKNPGDVVRFDPWLEFLKERARAGGAQREAYEFYKKWKKQNPEGNYEQFYRVVSSRKLSKHQKMKWQTGIDNKWTAWGNYASYLHLLNPKGVSPGDFWSISTKPFRGAHFAVYPEAICVRPIKSSCPPDGVVLDPMCGVGTTCATAKKLGRKWIGIDINPVYVDMANKRLNAIPERLDTFL